MRALAVRPLPTVCLADQLVIAKKLTQTSAMSTVRIENRASSVYPRSHLSNPFDLTLSDDDEDDLNNVFTDSRRHDYEAESDHGANFTIYEDADDADAYVAPSFRTRLKKTLTRCFS